MKAELLRKHDEVSKAKSSHIVDNFVPRKTERHAEKRTKSKNLTTKNDRGSESYEDSEMLTRSKKVLEAKSKFYDKMSSTGGSLNSDENCLVMFNQKKQSGEVNTRYESSSSDEAEAESNNTEASGEWVEYTDCLGRTRKCLKEDVEFFKKKDGELAETVAERNKANGVTVRIGFSCPLFAALTNNFFFRFSRSLLNGFSIQKAILSYLCKSSMLPKTTTP